MTKEEWRKTTEAELKLTLIWSNLSDKKSTIKRTSLLIERSKTLTSTQSLMDKKILWIIDTSKFLDWRAI